MRAVLEVASLSSRASTRTERGSVAPMKIVAGNITAPANSAKAPRWSERVGNQRPHPGVDPD